MISFSQVILSAFGLLYNGLFFQHIPFTRIETHAIIHTCVCLYGNIRGNVKDPNHWLQPQCCSFQERCIAFNHYVIRLQQATEYGGCSQVIVTSPLKMMGIMLVTSPLKLTGIMLVTSPLKLTGIMPLSTGVFSTSHLQ